MTIVSRRDLLAVAAGTAALAAVARPVLAQQPAAMHAAATPFVLPPLGYAKNALEPSIDAMTVELHHDKHHAAYVANLNAAAEHAPQIASHPMEYVLAHLSDVPESQRMTVRNNMGGHVNHSMYWEVMGPGGGQPGGAVLDAINRDLGGMEKLKTDFDGAGARVFGSGWIFVTVTQAGKLAIETRPNQDTPLMDGGRVLFGNDVWEHAYYLKYQNRRADYLNAWWSILNWSRIEKRYDNARAGTLAI